MYALVLLLVGPDVDRLGSPSWVDREWAELRLRGLGWLAVPELLRGSRSDDPEVRDRCQRLLVSWRSLRLDLEAATLLCAPWPLEVPELVAAFNNDAIRRRMHRIALAAGVSESDARHLSPDNDVWCWFQSLAPQALFAMAVERSKRHLGTTPGWPFN